MLLAITAEGTRAFLERWHLPDWSVAGGTLLLAIGTFVLAKRARDEAKAVRDEASAVARQVEIEAEQLIAAQRPLVLPVAGHDNVNGIPHLGLKNAGQGPAMNVRGSLHWTGTAGGHSALHPQVLAAGDEALARVLGEGAVVNWSNAVGYLRYHDLSGAEWQTHFQFRVDGLGNVRVEVRAAGSTGDFGEPAYNAEQGWVNKPTHVDLWQVAV